MPDFKRLKVWQRAHQLTLAVYQATSVFPPDERYGLTSQMRRAAASIGANLAEGCGRDGDAELTRFCQIAMGSASELEYHLLLGRDLGFLEESPYSDLADGSTPTNRMLASLIVYLRCQRRPSRTQRISSRRPGQ